MGNDRKTRVEHDLLGQRELPAEALYGIQTLRGMENFSISRFRLEFYPAFINGLALPDEAKKELLEMTPAGYTGIASKLAGKI